MRLVEIAIVALGATIGLAVHGLLGAGIGAAAAALIATTGVKSLRANSSKLSIHLSSHELRELEICIQGAIAATWALRPWATIASDRFRGAIAFEFWNRMVMTYAEGRIISGGDMFDYYMAAVRSDIKPDAALRTVKRYYAPRIMRKDTEVIFAIAQHVLTVAEEYGPTSDGRAWFLRWCDEIGIGNYGPALWNHHFGQYGDDLPPVTELYAARQRADALAHADDED